MMSSSRVRVASSVRHVPDAQMQRALPVRRQQARHGHASLSSSRLSVTFHIDGTQLPPRSEVFIESVVRVFVQ